MKWFIRVNGSGSGSVRHPTVVQKIDFLRRFMGEWPQKISGDIIVLAAQQLGTKIKFQCFVV